MSNTWNELFVLGAGGHAKVVADLCLCAGHTVAGFVDCDPSCLGKTILGLPVEGDENWLVEHARQTGPIAVALGVGDNQARERVASWCAAHGFLLPALAHPSAVVATSVQLGDGTVVMAGTVVNPDSQVGAGVILNTGCVVEHDNRIGAYAHLSANATTGGNVVIGARTHLGLGSTVLPGTTVGDDVIVGANSLVRYDCGNRVVLVGVPARVLRDR